MNAENSVRCLMALAFMLGVAGCGSAASSSGGDSVFILAARGDFTAVRSALQNGFDVNTPDEDGRTLTHYAVAAVQPALLETLIVTYRANPKLPDKEGRTAVDMAKELNDPALLRILDAEGML